MLQKKDDSRHRELRTKRTDKRAVDVGRANMLKTPRDGLQDLDGVFAGFALAVPAEEPRRDSEDDDDEGVAECGDEEEHTSSAGVSLGQPVTAHTDEVQAHKTRDPKRSIEFRTGQELQRVDDDFIRGSTSAERSVSSRPILPGRREDLLKTALSK